MRPRGRWRTWSPIADGVLSREELDVLYLRRGIEPEQAVAIEREPRSRSIKVAEAQWDSAAPTKAPDEEAACG